MSESKLYPWGEHKAPRDRFRQIWKGQKWPPLQTGSGASSKENKHRRRGIASEPTTVCQQGVKRVGDE